MNTYVTMVVDYLNEDSYAYRSLISKIAKYWYLTSGPKHIHEFINQRSYLGRNIVFDYVVNDVSELNNNTCFKEF